MISLEKEIEKREEILRERDQLERKVEELESKIADLEIQKDEVEKLISQKDYNQVETELRFLKSMAPISEPVVEKVNQPVEETIVEESPVEEVEAPVVEEAPVEVAEKEVEKAEVVEAQVEKAKIGSSDTTQNVGVTVTPSTQQTTPRTTDPFGATVGRINF